MIVFQRSVIEEFDELVFSLYTQDYFYSLIAAEVYVDKIIDFIKTEISTFPSKKSPKKLQAYGSRYIFYNADKGTTWFIFFENYNQNYLITRITNNHCGDSNYLNEDI